MLSNQEAFKLRGTRCTGFLTEAAAVAMDEPGMAHAPVGFTLSAAPCRTPSARAVRSRGQIIASELPISADGIDPQTISVGLPF